MKKQRIILRTLAVLLILGGVTRLFADEIIFEFCGMKDLWVSHPYFVYIYKVLGAFVILTGLLFAAISRKIRRNLNVLRTLQWGFVFVGIVMAVAGYLSQLHLIFYAPDFVFCFVIAFLIYRVVHHYKKTVS